MQHECGKSRVWIYLGLRYRNTFVRFVVISENHKFVVNSWIFDSPRRIMMGWRWAQSKIFKKSFGGGLKAMDVGGTPNHVKIKVYSSPFLSSIYLLNYAYYVFDKMLKWVNICVCFEFSYLNCTLALIYSWYMFVYLLK